jgi:hypothetical protein
MKRSGKNVGDLENAVAKGRKKAKHLSEDSGDDFVPDDCSDSGDEEMSIVSGSSSSKKATAKKTSSKNKQAEESKEPKPEKPKSKKQIKEEEKAAALEKQAHWDKIPLFVNATKPR